MKNKKGFTLIELMIVVAIIAILAMIAVPMYQRYIERARNSAAENLLHQLATAMTAYNVDNSVYVTDTAASGVAATTLAQATELLRYGFRVDPNVGFQMWAPGAVGGITEPGFIAYAAHRATGSRLYVYDNIQGSGVMQMQSLTQTDPVAGAAAIVISTACNGTLDVLIPNPANPSTGLQAAATATITVSATGIVQ